MDPSPLKHLTSISYSFFINIPFIYYPFQGTGGAKETTIIITIQTHTGRTNIMVIITMWMRTETTIIITMHLHTETTETTTIIIMQVRMEIITI